MKNTLLRTLYLLILTVSVIGPISGQEVPVQHYTVSPDGVVQLEVNSTTEKYYILKIRHDTGADFELATSMTLGKPGTTTITESTRSYPLDHYQVIEYPIDSPADTDGDGINDILEFQHLPMQSPLNAATPVPMADGSVAIDSFNTFKALSITDDYVQWSEFLNGKVHVKYIIADFQTSNPKVYFINSNSYALHEDFADHFGISNLGDQVKKGQIIYHPTVVSDNGTLGTYAFNYSNGHGDDFEVVQKTYELLAANMPFLKNNLSYFITALNTDEYTRDTALFQNSRIPILFEDDVYADVDYWGLHSAEGFGFFRLMNLTDVPDTKDIVLYEALPNSLPRVGGIITSVMQTPLSHVNLRAIQDNIPNAFIRDPLSIDSIANLLDHYIYFKAEPDKYFIREATLEEVNAWFEDIRPAEEQIPTTNLDYTSILPLDDIFFGMADGFGAKCTNVATMRTFGFPDGVIPDGFGVPFYFYQEFMKYNHLFEEIATIINDPEFQSNRDIRDDKLNAFRDKIKASAMPDWMMAELEAMQQSFPAGTAIRCRSSSNVEDLPGFNGAGLYSSYTQYPDEGHISKSIKQVYASFWNLRAYEEREFNRVNHFIASMGVLCHPNNSGEKANGVAVSVDPIYNTSNTFYLNAQLGEDLITNPGNTALPEEILLDKVPVSENDYIIVQHSNLVSSDSTIMQPQHLDEMRDYLTVIHHEFALLYKTQDDEDFAMEIEYKISGDNRLIIKQARPWVSNMSDEDPEEVGLDSLMIKIFPNPAHDYIHIFCLDCNIASLHITDITGKRIQETTLSPDSDLNHYIQLPDLPAGMYLVTGVSNEHDACYTGKFIRY